MVKFLAAANVLQIALIAWRYRFLPEQIPFFYSKPWGEAQIADIWYILLLPIYMNCMFFINSQISKRYFSTNTLFTKMLAITNGIIIVGFTSIFIKILLLIT